jgi:hypothetical protein
MRRTMIGLGVAVLVAVGCSDSDGGGDATAGDGEGGSGGSGGSAEQFCEDFQALDEQFANDPEAANDPQAVLTALEALEPPDEIADDFRALIEVSRVQAELDVEDTEAVDEFESLVEESAEAQERFASFVDEECAVDDEGDDGATTESGETTDTSLAGE